MSVYKYRPARAATGAVPYFGEYTRSFAMTALLAVRARRGGWIDAIQTCNPPDIFWPLGITWRRHLRRARFVFDQHDLCPELFESRFPQGSRSFG